MDTNNIKKVNLKLNAQVGERLSSTFLHLLKRKWLSIWKGNPPGLVLLLFAFCTAMIMSIPIIYVMWQSLFAGVDRWKRLFDERIPILLWNTLSLAFAVTVCAVMLGVSLAWIVARTNVPGRKVWQWVLALPLVIPPYVGAVAYIMVFGRSGWARDVWQNSQFLATLFGEYPIDIYSFWGVFFVMTMFTYPYVYLISYAALRKMNYNFEEAARSLGNSTIQIFWKVNLPLMRPSIGAGAVLVALYVMSDFGAIATLRYVTFTAAIYFQRAGFDTASAAVLSLILMLLTVIMLLIESCTRKKNRYYQTTNTYRKSPVLKVGKWRYLGFAYVGFIFTISVLIPIAVLVYWSNIGVRMGAIDDRFWGFALNSLKVSGIAALICMLSSIPTVYLKSRYPSCVSRLIERFSYSGYALPGVISALGFIFIFNNHIPTLYGTFHMISLAFVVRFLTQAMQAGNASLSLISPRIDEAARSLGYSPWKVMFKVILPNMLPGVLAGGALVFVSSIKELPATLMLRPPGFDTLAVRVYFDAHERMYHLAAPAALLIILISLIPLRYMLKKY